jgi:short-chain fatty acids transporter
MYQHFVVKAASLDLNAMLTALLMLAVLLQGSIGKLLQALSKGAASCWQVMVLYQLYGAVAGVLQYTSVGEVFAQYFAHLATPATFTLLTALAGTLVAIFVPSSGGQWVIQGFVTAKTAAAVGATPQQGLLALGIGDQMGNLISPFWMVITASIGGIEFRKIFGYSLLFAVLWFVLATALFTLLPAH